MGDEVKKEGGLLEKYRRAAGKVDDGAPAPEPAPAAPATEGGSLVDRYRAAAGGAAPASKPAPDPIPAATEKPEPKAAPASPPTPGPKTSIFGDSESDDLGGYVPADMGEARKELERFRTPMNFPSEEELLAKGAEAAYPAGAWGTQQKRLALISQAKRKLSAPAMRTAAYEKLASGLTKEDAAILKDYLFGTGERDRLTEQKMVGIIGGASQRHLEAFRERIDVALATDAIRKIQNVGDKILSQYGENSREFELYRTAYERAEKYSPTIQIHGTDEGTIRIHQPLDPSQARAYLDEIEKLMAEEDEAVSGPLRQLLRIGSVVKGMTWGAIDPVGGEHLWGMASGQDLSPLSALAGVHVPPGVGAGAGLEDSILAHDPEVIARFLANESIGSQVISGAFSLLPAIISVGGLGRAFATGAAKYVGPAMAEQTGNALAMMLYSAGQGEDPLAAGAAGFLEPAVVKHLDMALGRVLWKMGPRAAASGALGSTATAMAESVGGVLTGVAVHGIPTPSEAMIDAIVGAAFGFSQGRSTVVKDLADLHAKYEGATTPAAKEKYHKEWRELFDKTIGKAEKEAREAGRAALEEGIARRDAAAEESATPETPVEAPERPQEPSVPQDAPQAPEPVRAPEKPSVDPEAGAYREAPWPDVPGSPRARDYKSGQEYADAQMGWLRERAKTLDDPEQVRRIDRAMDEIQNQIDRGQAEDIWRDQRALELSATTVGAEQGAFEPAPEPARAPEKAAEAPVEPWARRQPGEEHVPVRSPTTGLKIVIDESLAASATYNPGYRGSEPVIRVNPKKYRPGEGILAHEEAHHAWSRLDQVAREVISNEVFPADIRRHMRRGARQEGTLDREWAVEEAFADYWRAGSRGEWENVPPVIADRIQEMMGAPRAPVERARTEETGAIIRGDLPADTPTVPVEPAASGGSGFSGVMLHGSPSEGLSVVSSRPEARQYDNGTSPLGAFFTPNRGEAQRYAGKEGTVYEARVDLKNPYEMPWSEFNKLQSPDRGPNGEKLPPSEWAARLDSLKAEGEALRERLEAEGYDGVIVKSSRGKLLEVASFADVPVGAGRVEPAKAPEASPKAEDAPKEGAGVSFVDMMRGKTEPPPPADAAGNKIPDPVEAVKPPEPTGDIGRTSHKNRMVDDDRIARGLDRMEAVAREGNEVAFTEAEKRIKEYHESGRNYVEEVLSEAANNPTRRLDRVEQAALLRYRVDLKTRLLGNAEEVIRARDRGDLDAMQAAKDNVDATENALVMLDGVTKRAGTETARDLNFRKVELERDYSIAEMRLRARVENDGAPLNERQSAKVERLHKELRIREKRLARAEARIKKLEMNPVDAAIERAKADSLKAKPRRKSYGESNVGVKKSDLPKIEEEFRKAFGEGLRGGPIPLPTGALKPAAKWVAFHLEAGTRSAAQITKLLVDKFGEAVRPYAAKIIAAARDEYSGTASKKATEALAAGFGEGKSLAEMQRHVDTVIDTLIRSGVDEREVLMARTTEIIKGIDPKVTDRDVREAFTSYGKVRPLDPDETKAKIRDLRDQVRSTLKLQDMAEGRAPLASGWEKQLPSEEARRLTKEVNQAKKELDSPDDAAHIKSALDTEKRRMQNEMDDLERQLKQGFKDEATKRTLILDDEAKAMKKRLGALRKQFREAFGKKGLTDEQRLNARIKAAERTQKIYEDMIASGDPTPRKRGGDPVTSPKLEAIKARNDALKEQIKEMRLALKPKKTAEEIAIQRTITRQTNQIAKWEEAMAAGDPSIAGNRTPTEIKAPTPEYIDSRAAYNSAQKRWRNFLVDQRLANRTLTRKAVDLVIGQPLHASRAFMTSIDVSAVGRQGLFLGLSHPILAMKAIPDMFRAAKSERGLARLNAKIEAHPKYNEAQRAGLFLSDFATSNLNRMEEEMMGRWVQHIPGVANSARAYSAYLNKLRMDAFDAMTTTLSRTGSATSLEQQAIANFINVATGRGGGGKLADQFSTLNSVLFAPRNMVSRFQLLTGQPFRFNKTGTVAGDMGVRARKLIAAEYLRTAVGYSVAFGLAKMAGAEIETDPRSSDFLKWRFGTTRIDPWAGMQQAAVLMSRVWTNETKSLRDGEVKSLSRKDGGFNRTIWDVISSFGRSKLAPVPGGFFNWRAGENIVGEEQELGTVLKGLYTPLIFQDIMDIAEQQGIPRATAVGLLAFFGLGVSDFDPEED